MEREGHCCQARPSSRIEHGQPQRHWNCPRRLPVVTRKHHALSTCCIPLGLPLLARCSLLAARCQPARCLDSLAAASPEQGCAPIHSPTPRPQRPSMRGPQFCPAVFFRDRSCALARRWLVPPVQSPDIAKLLFALSRPCDVCCLEPARCSDMMLVT